jgi:heptosyltransferase-1
VSTPVSPRLQAQPSQTPAAPRITPPGRLLVVRLSAMGDIIHAMPAIAALRLAQPDLQIGWLIEERWSELLCSRESERMGPRSELKPLADWVHIANFSGWRRSLFAGDTWQAMRSCRADLRGMKYTSALDLQGAIRSALAACVSGAKVRIGSSQPREAPATIFYSRSVDVAGTHVVQHALSLASAIAGRELPYAHPPFPTDPLLEAWAQEQHNAQGGKPLVILNPGAGWGAKCWPAESFAAVARALAERRMAVLINHGPGEEALAEAVRVASGDSAVLLKCSVGELVALTRRARLFIGGDTGPMHLAAALHVPVVALFGPTRPQRNGPFATRSIVLRSPESVDNTAHTDSTDQALASIVPASVIAAVDELLGEPGV